MKLYEKISILQDEKQLKNSELSRATNIPNSTLSDILKGKTEKISLQAIIALAKALDCTIDYLAYDEVSDRFFGDEYTINRAEYNHIEKYRTLDSHGKTLIDTVLDIEHTRCTTTSSPTAEHFSVYEAQSLMPFQLSEYKASAGRGTYLGPEAFTTIMVEKNDLTKRALFGVPVSGDSMEPTYHDEDILIVERADELKTGEIGIFTLDGEGYVKKCGNGELSSLNEKYKPIPMNETILLNGKVIGILKKEWIVE